MARAPDTDPSSTPSAPLVDSLALAIFAIGRQAQQLLEAELASNGLTLRHYGALGHLAGNPSLSISDLARRSGVTAQSMHATVRGLEAMGAIVTHDQGRGRPARFTVTGQGWALLGRARAAVLAVDATIAMHLRGRDAEALRRILTSLSARLHGR